MTETTSLIWPAILAAVGYLAKSVYDIIIDGQKRKRALLEDKLKKFYWPVLTLLEENESIYELVFNKHKHDTNESKIALYIERNALLKNHDAILAIISANRYLADFDEEFGNEIKSFIRHVVIYKALVESKMNSYPAVYGSTYPKNFDAMVKLKAEQLQKQFDKSRV
jgi:predicted Zn-dependent protease